MAQNVTIETMENVAKILIDGHEIKEVLSYHVYEEAGRIPRMSIEFEITGRVEARIG